MTELSLYAKHHGHMAGMNCAAPLECLVNDRALHDLLALDSHACKGKGPEGTHRRSMAASRWRSLLERRARKAAKAVPSCSTAHTRPQRMMRLCFVFTARTCCTCSDKDGPLHMGLDYRGMLRLQHCTVPLWYDTREMSLSVPAYTHGRNLSSASLVALASLNLLESELNRCTLRLSSEAQRLHTCMLCTKQAGKL